MTADLQPYDERKDSGVPWIEPVPKHWERRRLKSLLRPVDKRSSTGTETLLSLRRDHGVVIYSDHFARPAQGATTIGYKLVRAGQLVLNRLQANNGLVFDSPYDGLVSPDYSVFEPRQSLRMRFLSLLFRTDAYKDHFRREATGLGTGSAGFLRLYDDRFLETPVFVPSLIEQDRALRFLDYMAVRIRRYARAKKRLIALLNEQKQTIIYRAVTRGLDSTVRVKPSGLGWVGDVPAHWQILPIGRIATVGNGSTPSRSEVAYWSGGTFPWLNSSSVNAGRICSANQFVTDRALRDCHLPRVPAGSVLVAITGQGRTRGTAAVLTIEATINQHIAFIALQPGKTVTAPEYLRLFLAAAYGELRRISDDSGSTKGALTCEGLRRFRVAVPPIDEQLRIARWAQDATCEIEAVILATQRELALLDEFSRRFVADVVTGKLDVRDAARRLPEESGDVEPPEPGESDLVEDVEDVDDPAIEEAEA